MPKVEALPQSWGTRYWFYCEGCKGGHAFQVRTDGTRPSWSFNGDVECPTFSPSLLIRGCVNQFSAPGVVNPDEPGYGTCHLFLTDGKIHYLSDCSHHLAGQVVDLPEVD